MTMRIVAAAIAAVVLAACSNSNPPTSPETLLSPLANSFEGVWTVKYKLEGCGGYRHCVIIRGEIRTIYLHLERVGDGYDGVVDLGNHVTVSGSVGADGTLTLTGRRPAANPDDYAYEIESLTLPAARSQQSTAGAIRYTVQGPSNSSFFGSAVTHGPITSIERIGPLESATSFTGTWTGSIPIRSCDATGWPHCYPFWNDTTYPMTLTLSPGSAGVEGTLRISGQTIPVSGVAAGSSLRLTGSASPPSSGVNVTYLVAAERLVADRVGRLTGDLTMSSTYDWHDGRGIWTVRYPPLPLHAVARSLR